MERFRNWKLVELSFGKGVLKGVFLGLVFVVFLVVVVFVFLVGVYFVSCF